MCSWKQIVCLLCIIYDLELIDIFSKFKHSKSYNFLLNCCPPKPTFKDLTLCSTWQQTFSHSKSYSYHICYPNLACLSSLKNWLQGAFSYQISSSAPKSIKSCGIKPERVSRKQKAQFDSRPLVTQNIITIP